MKTMSHEQAIKFIEENITTNGIVFAVRGDDFIPKNKFRKSWNRPDGVKTTRKNGVCGMLVAQSNSWDESPESIKKEIENAKSYGSNVFLICGTSYYSGNDEYSSMQEICIKNHKVVCRIV